jgi:hypothetical protein
MLNLWTDAIGMQGGSLRQMLDGGRRPTNDRRLPH